MPRRNRGYIFLNIPHVSAEERGIGDLWKGAMLRFLSFQSLGVGGGFEVQGTLSVQVSYT